MSAAGVRMRWVDVVKGLCMVLVVLRHSALWLETQFNQGSLTFWWEVSEFLSPIRMPLFFLISGYLVARAVRRPISQSRARTFGIFYIYVIWTALFLLRLWIQVPGVTDPPPSWGHFLAAILLPTSFWYLWALVFFFVSSRIALALLGERSVWLILPLFALAFAGSALDDYFIPVLPDPLDALKFGSIALNFVWFFAGVHAHGVWDRMMSTATRKSAAIWVSAYVAVYAAAAWLDVRQPLQPALALVALIATAHLIPRVPLQNPIANWLERVGALTLPVYIFHIFAISALSVLTKVSGAGDVIADHIQLSGAVIPPLLMLVIIWMSMMIGRAILASRLRWLLSPDWLKTTSASQGRSR